MDDNEEKLAGFYENSIPSLIYQVRKGRLSADRASRAFSEQLKELRNRDRAQQMLNRLNQELRAIRQNKSGQEHETVSSGTNPVVVIDGPSSIGNNQSIILSAQTENFPQDEGYKWEVQGNIPGVVHRPGESSGDGSRTYLIETNTECGTGTLYITASGNLSAATGATTIHVVGKKPEEKGQPEDPRNRNQEESESDPKAVGTEKEPAPQDKIYSKVLKSFQDKLKSKLTKQALAALWKALLPYMPWIILAVILIVAGIAIFAGLTKKASTGEAGSTLHQQTDVASDSELLEKVMLATGDKDTRASLNSKIFPDIQKQLLALKEKTDPEIQERISDTSAKIDRYISTNDPALGKEIVANVKEILSSLDQQAPAIKTATRSPLDKITDYNFSLHYGTPLRKEMGKNGEGHATYMYHGEGKADAVDLYTDKDSMVFPVFSGKISGYSDDGTGHKKVVIKNGAYEILYANFITTKDLSVGQSVSTETAIGKVPEIEGQSQLHVELSYGGNPITTTALDKINYMDGSKPWGQYLWEHMKKVLNLR